MAESNQNLEDLALWLEYPAQRAIVSSLLPQTTMSSRRILSKVPAPKTPPVYKAVMSFVKPQTMVTFIVDIEDRKQTFLVHKDLACISSPFFKAAFESKMSEGLTQSMRLEDVEGETFGLLVNWMYNHTIERQASFSVTDRDTSADIHGRKFPNLYPLVKLWNLGDRTLIPALQNEAMTMIYSLMDDATHDHIIDIAHFACLSEQKSMLKEAVVSKFAWCWGPVMLDELSARLPTEIIANVALQLKQRFHMAGKLDRRCAEDFFAYDSNGVV